jgi:hypothetical protein
MSLFKRHIGRRVTLVGVAVALLVLGLEAPAFAVPPTVDSFSPASGPVGCVVVITGTNFDNPTATLVEFNGVDATDFSVVSGTEIWATVPVGATNGPITVTNASPPAGTSAAGFTVTAATSPGGCAPTVTSFTPACALAGTTVKITGTNLLRSADPATTPTSVQFVPYGTDAVHTIPNAETPTELSVLVPSGATDGPIRVVTFATTGGTIFSTTQFQVPPPDCPTGGAKHARSITLSLRKALVARGKVSSTETPAVTECVAAVPVKIQRRRAGGGWRTVGSTTTTDTGAYKKRIKNRHGKYRALAPKVTLDDASVCSRAVSPVRKH